MHRTVGSFALSRARPQHQHAAVSALGAQAAKAGRAASTTVGASVGAHDGAPRPVCGARRGLATVAGGAGVGVTCDVAIVGAGIWGMSTAYQLKRRDPSLNVQVFEQVIAT